MSIVVRWMAPLCFSGLIQKKLRDYVRNEITFICAKFGVDLINTSKVTSRKTKWSCFLGPYCSASKRRRLMVFCRWDLERSTSPSTAITCGLNVH